MGVYVCVFVLVCLSVCVFTTLNCVFTGGIHLTIVHICFRSDSGTDVGHNIYLPANRTMLIYTLFDTAVHTARDAGMKNNGSKTFELISHYKCNSTSIERKKKYKRLDLQKGVKMVYTPCTLL